MKFSKNTYIFSFLQIGIYLFVNVLFVVKYTARTSVSPLLSASVFVLFFISLALIYKKTGKYLSEKTYKILIYSLLTIAVASIIALLIYINPYSVRVDRWSATTFFLDAMFRGDYPYGVHTHVSETNFPSPFPAWHLINVPFYLLGDVGIGLIFFLLLVFFVLKTYTHVSYQKLFVFFALLFISPAYWWETTVRSDSLSNAFLVFACIVWFEKTGKTLSDNLLTAVILCGLIAATRLSAILPIAIYFFRPFIKLEFKQKINLIAGVSIIVLLFFVPFIFWDTSNWSFFHRNPFMSQTSVGNKFVFIAMIVIGIFFSLKWKGFHSYLAWNSLFLFLFVLISNLSLIVTRGISVSLFDDPTYDVSYFTLLFPYCLSYLSGIFHADTKKGNYTTPQPLSLSGTFPKRKK